MRQFNRFYWLGLKTQPKAVANANNPGRSMEYEQAKTLDEKRAVIAKELEDTQTDGVEGVVPDLPMNEQEEAEAIAEVVAQQGLQAGEGQPPLFA